MYHIEPMSLPYAKEISSWSYPGEYAMYSFVKNDETINELLDGGYFACLDPERNLAGYFCYGIKARIPTVEKDVYDAERLDIGLGLKPELCGKGLGYAFMKAGMDYAKKHLQAKALRLTVACFNKRAVNLYRKLGFEITCEITHAYSHTGFYLMNCITGTGCDS